MALINQIAPIVNDAVKDALGGQESVTAVKSTDFVSLGKTLGDGLTQGSFDLYEAFFASLANRLVKTVYATRVYSANLRGILRDETEWGAFKQKVHYNLTDAVTNPSYNIPQRDEGDPTYNQVSPYDVSTTVGIKALMFGGQGTWSIEIVRPIAQIMTAFTGAAEMAAFIDGIYVYIENSMQMQIESVENAAANTGIALTLKKGYARNLLAEYNATLAQGDAALTVATCMSNGRFLRFAAKEIRMATKYMGKMLTLYNTGNMPKFTPDGDMVVEFLDEFATASEIYMQSDTFHDELVRLPRYRTVPFWQTAGQNLAFADVSTVSVQHDDLIADPEDGEDTGTVTQSGIIAFIHDVDAVAANFGEMYTWEQPNVRQRVVNHGQQARKGYAVDPNENMAVFYVADAVGA